MSTDSTALLHAPSRSSHRVVATRRAWRCVACGRYHGTVTEHTRPRQCKACHSPAIYAVSTAPRSEE